MIKSLRNKFISVLTLVACVMFAMLIGVNANFVKADEVVDTNVFTMWNTAAIRTDKDPAGIRFGAQLGLEKFKALAGEEEGASINVVFTANKAGADVSLEKTKTYTVTAEDFANDEDGIINIMYTLTFDNAWDDAKKQEAYAMSLTVGCKAYKGETKVADLGAITQDARAVASFNDLIDGTEAYKGYYTSANMVDGVAPYVAGTVGTRIYVDGLTADYSNIYVNTTKVNATVNNGFVTIAKADMAKLLTTAPKNIIQAIDANGNVIAKELTEVVDTYAETVTFSAMDGDIDYSKILGNETVTGVEVVSSTAEQTSTVAFAENKLTGVDTLNGEWTNVQIKVMTEYSAKLVNLKVATKIIDEADDLQVFAVKQRDDTRTGSEALYGYFVLANEIDAKDIVIEHEWTLEGAKLYPTSNDKGFKGVFDGQGHVISNFTAQSCGLFGKIDVSSSVVGEQGVVKNVAFINAKATGRYVGLISHTLAYASMENVYIDFTIEASNNISASSTYLFSFSGSCDLKLDNVVVEASVGNLVNGDGVIKPYGINAVYTAASGGGERRTLGAINNAYYITEAPVYVSTNYLGVAGNVTVDEEYIKGLKYVPEVESATYTFENLKSYSNRAKMMADKDANVDSLATFSDDYWMIFNGVPLWKGADNFVAVSDSEIVNVDTPANLSLLDKKGNAVDGVTVTLSGEGEEYVIVEGMQIRVPATYVISQNYDLTATLTATIDGVEVVKTVKLSVVPATGKTIENVYVEADGTLVGLSDEDAILLANATYSLDDNALTLADGKFNATAFENKTLGEYYDVSAIADGKINTLKVRYVTKAIDEAEDLKVFQITPHSYDQTTNKSLGSNAITGFYVLVKHIDATGLTLSHTYYSNLSYPNTTYDKGFKGVFDGQGYTISNFTAPSTGLFGRIDVRDNPGCGIIKNVAFINAKVSTSGYSQLLSHHAMGSSDSLFVENVYIDFQVYKRGGYALFGNGTYLANINNVVVKATTNETLTGTYYGFTDLYSTVGNTFKSIENTFIIGDMPVSYEGSVVVAVAGNSTDTSETIKLTVNGIKTYVDATAMTADATANKDSLDAMEKTGYFTVTNGVPAWANMPQVNA